MVYGGGIMNELILPSKSSLNIVIVRKPDIQKACSPQHSDSPFKSR